jgi:hypothetical protein
MKTVRDYAVPPITVAKSSEWARNDGMIGIEKRHAAAQSMHNLTVCGNQCSILPKLELCNIICDHSSFHVSVGTILNLELLETCSEAF